MRIGISEKSAKEPQISTRGPVLRWGNMHAFGDVTMPWHVAPTKTVSGAIVRAVHCAHLTIKLAPQQHKRNTSFLWYVTITVGTAVREGTGSISYNVTKVPAFSEVQAFAFELPQEF